MSTVYRHCTTCCMLHLFVTRCCLRTNTRTSPSSVENPWAALCVDTSILASYSVLVFNSILQFKTKQVEGTWDKCNVKAATEIMRSKDNPSVEINWESEYWREQRDSRKCCYMGLEHNFLRRFTDLLWSKIYNAAQELTIMHTEWVRRKGEYWSISRITLYSTFWFAGLSWWDYLDDIAAKVRLIMKWTLRNILFTELT